MKLLVKTSFDYADEFDVDGFFLLNSKEELEEIYDTLQKYFDNNNEPYEQCFGTNEEIMLETVDEYKQGLNVTEITDEEHAVLTKHFGDGYGTPIIPQ